MREKPQVEEQDDDTDYWLEVKLYELLRKLDVSRARSTSTTRMS